MSKKNIKTSSQTASDYNANKLLSVFALAFAAILGVVFLSSKMRVPAWPVTHAVIAYLAYFFSALSVVCLVMTIVVGKNRRPYKLITWFNVGVVSLFFAACSWIINIWFDKATLTYIYVLIPSVALVYIVYGAYQREFFGVCLMCGAGAFLSWLATATTSYTVFFIAALALVAVAGLVATVFSQARRSKIFGDCPKYLTLYVAIALLLIAAAVIAITGSAYMYPVIFTQLGYIVLTGIYFTVKLI